MRAKKVEVTATHVKQVKNSLRDYYSFEDLVLVTNDKDQYAIKHLLSSHCGNYLYDRFNSITYKIVKEETINVSFSYDKEGNEYMKYKGKKHAV